MLLRLTWHLHAGTAPRQRYQGLIRKFAGRRHFRMAAEIRHVGRKSGRAYVTPAGARISADVAVIPLTFGNQSGWSKNVRAAGGCSIRLDGQDYAATELR